MNACYFSCEILILTNLVLLLRFVVMVKESSAQPSKQEVKIIYPYDSLMVEVKEDGVWVSNDLIIISKAFENNLNNL